MLGAKVTGKPPMIHEIAFKAHSPVDTEKWCTILSSVAGGTAAGKPPPSKPGSPVESKNVSRTHPQQPSVQVQDVTPTTRGTDERRQASRVLHVASTTSPASAGRPLSEFFWWIRCCRREGVTSFGIPKLQGFLIADD
jgi:hypothetical protein